ncbi:thaumatin, partial [Thamnidium elegans]
LTFAAPSFQPNTRETTTLVKIINKCKKPIQLYQLGNQQSQSSFDIVNVGGTQSYRFNGPWSGRFWARHEECWQSSTCQGASTTAPASLVEFTFLSADGNDFYDISFVDGYNLPVSIEPAEQSSKVGKGYYWCRKPACRNVPTCPQELKVWIGGVYSACQSACSKFGNQAYCCAGLFDTPEKCGINKYAQLIKDECPDAYSFAYDDEKSLYQCQASVYTVTWC